MTTDKMRKFQTAYLIFGLALGLIGGVLCWIWFGWKLLLIVFLLMWSNNISIKDNR